MKIFCIFLGVARLRGPSSLKSLVEPWLIAAFIGLPPWSPHAMGIHALASSCADTYDNNGDKPLRFGGVRFGDTSNMVCIPAAYGLTASFHLDLLSNSTP